MGKEMKRGNSGETLSLQLRRSGASVVVSGTDVHGWRIREQGRGVRSLSSALPLFGLRGADSVAPHRPHPLAGFDLDHVLLGVGRTDQLQPFQLSLEKGIGAVA